MPPRELLYELHLPEPPPSNNAIKGMHFHAYKKLRNGWRARVLAAISGKAPTTPLVRSALEIERHCAGSLDWDNAYGGLKPLLDCLVVPSARNPDGLGLIQDDSPKFMPEAPRMAQVTARRGKGCTVVRIYAVDQLACGDCDSVHGLR
ncbi:hypothetical protein CSQ91_21580 [Janthinobacterium sp. BJB301]|uniref:hypothetical protein n=1 Tax=Janthinobacterium sp. BJB301 TaxID=1560195 RepID=UPI000C0E01D7|nr:hypothetical protein [Janthinobacterium sp. BJB301]PHV48370.1 hypothetical protein CSQ91_21580 [Janthinobacterium sp. BJB301]